MVWTLGTGHQVEAGRLEAGQRLPGHDDFRDAVFGQELFVS